MNGNIISNKARFSYDSLINNRIYEKNDLSCLNWNALLNKYYNIEKKTINLLILINEQLDIKILNRLKFLTYLDSNIKLKSLSRFNDSINEFDKNQNLCSIILGSTVETENEIVNSKIRLKVLNQDYAAYGTNLSYASKISDYYINLRVNEMLTIFEGKFKKFSQYI